MRKWAETEVAQAVDAYFRDLGYRTYPEVAPFGSGGQRADLIAVSEPVYVWVETKVSFGAAVMAQAHRALRSGANYVFVATPRGRRTEAQWFLERAARHYGIGVLIVTRGVVKGETRVKQDVPPRFLRWKKDSERYAREKLKAACVPETRCAEPGQAGGGHWTPFRQTIENLRRMLKKDPGLTTSEMMKGLSHHYASHASARSSLMQWARAGSLARYGIVVRPYGKTMRWYVEEASK